MSNKIRLNIGCGKNKIDGYIGIDRENFGQEYVRDLDWECLPFSDNSVDEILCKHTLEHLDNFWFATDEMWRVLKPTGKILIIVPHKDSDGAYYPGHRRYFNEFSFDGMFDKEKVRCVWKKISLIVNSRKEIHLEMKPIKDKQQDYGNILKLDLGCGKVKREGFIGIDISDYGQEIICDITKGIPFSDNSIEEIEANSILEHLSSDNLLFVMRECHRVLKKNGKFNIVVPFAGSDGSFRDPTHQNFWTENTFDYFCEGKPKHYDINPNHKFKKIKVEEKNGGAIYATLTPIKNEKNK